MVSSLTADIWRNEILTLSQIEGDHDTYELTVTEDRFQVSPLPSNSSGKLIIPDGRTILEHIVRLDEFSKGHLESLVSSMRGHAADTLHFQAQASLLTEHNETIERLENLRGLIYAYLDE